MFHMKGMGRRGGCGRMWGIGLMIAGLILMMIIVPRWAWVGILCVCIIVAGFAIWRGGTCG